MHQVVQIVGALLILAGFVLAQFRVLDPQSFWYLIVNLVGSAVLTVDAWREAQGASSCSRRCGRSSRPGGSAWPARGAAAVSGGPLDDAVLVLQAQGEGQAPVVVGLAVDREPPL